jgi:hypothetical protein
MRKSTGGGGLRLLSWPQALRCSLGNLLRHSESPDEKLCSDWSNDLHCLGLREPGL